MKPRLNDYRLDPYLYHGTSTGQLRRLFTTGFLYEPYVTPSIKMARCFAGATTKDVPGDPCLLRVLRGGLRLKVDGTLFTLVQDEFVWSAEDYASTDAFYTPWFGEEMSWGFGDAFFRVDGRDPNLARRELRELLDSGREVTAEDSLRIIRSAQVSRDVPLSALELAHLPDASEWFRLDYLVKNLDALDDEDGPDG